MRYYYCLKCGQTQARTPRTLIQRFAIKSWCTVTESTAWLLRCDP